MEELPAHNFQHYRQIFLNVGRRAVFLCVVFSWMGGVYLCQAATDDQKKASIDNALAWLASGQTVDGKWSTETNLFYYDVAATSSSILSFLESGHAAGVPVILNGHNYGDVVGRGLSYLFKQAQLYPISSQSAGDPDSDGNGYGVKFLPGSDDANDIYVASFALAAIAATGTPEAVVKYGALKGWTYRQVVQNTVDFLAYSQNDVSCGSSRGGWGSSANFGESDNSISSWPAWALAYADKMQVVFPQFVSTELRQWIEYIQYYDGSGSGFDGSSGYTSTLFLNNESKTGGLLSEMLLAGYSVTDQRVQAALSYLGRNWQNEIQPAVDYWNGNFGHPYAMFSIYQGLAAMIGIDDTQSLISLHPEGVIDSGDVWNWWEDYCEWIVSQQQVAGQWYGTLYWNQALATPWNIITLTGSPIYTRGVDEGSEFVIPEPASLFFLGIGLLNGVIVFRKRIA